MTNTIGLLLKIFTLTLLSQAAFAQDLSRPAKNVLGATLKKCSDSPKTGFYRDGFCHTGPQDSGTHVACATVTKKFLDFTNSKGNDLITPKPNWNFPGLKPGDKWCLCALRWLEAKKAGVAPVVDLDASQENMLKYAGIKELKK